MNDDNLPRITFEDEELALTDAEWHELLELRLLQSSDELDYNNADIP